MDDGTDFVNLRWSRCVARANKNGVGILTVQAVGAVSTAIHPDVDDLQIAKLQRFIRNAVIHGRKNPVSENGGEALPHLIRICDADDVAFIADANVEVASLRIGKSYQCNALC